MAVFTIVYELLYALPLTGFLIMEGVALVLIRRLIWRAAETLATALLLVRSERDAKTRSRCGDRRGATSVQLDSLLQGMLEHLRLQIDPHETT